MYKTDSADRTDRCCADNHPDCFTAKVEIKVLARGRTRAENAICNGSIVHDYTCYHHSTWTPINSKLPFITEQNAYRVSGETII